MSVATRAVFTGGITLAALTATKDPGNPTFPADSVPESIVKVGSTYWAVGMGWTTGDIRLWSASSPDGSWTAYGSNPILTGGSQAWEDSVLYAPHLMEDAGTFYLFYSSAPGATDTEGSIGLATATAVTGPYTKHAGNPILAYDSGPAWHDGRVSECSVIKDGADWVMAFMGATDADSHGTEKTGLAIASSPSGPWTEAVGNPLIPFGASGSFNELASADPALFAIGSRLWMLVTGKDAAGLYQAGFYRSVEWDGPWVPWREDAILTVGTGGSFDDSAAFRGSVYIEDAIPYLVYAGNDAPAFAGTMRGGSATLSRLP